MAALVLPLPKGHSSCRGSRAHTEVRVTHGSDLDAASLRLSPVTVLVSLV